jgi:hypothetical protein
MTSVATPQVLLMWVCQVDWVGEETSLGKRELDEQTAAGKRRKFDKNRTRSIRYRDRKVETFANRQRRLYDASSFLCKYNMIGIKCALPMRYEMHVPNPFLPNPLCLLDRFLYILLSLDS